MTTLRLVDGELDLDQRLVRRAGTHAVLTEQDVGLLAYLAARAGRAVPRDELATKVLGHRTRLPSRAVDHAIRRLRVKVEADPAQPCHIESVRGVGYRFRPLRDREEPLLGRADTLEALANVEGALVTLVGPGGVGKTSLAHARVADVGGRILELGRARSVSDVLAEVARMLGVSAHAEHLADDIGQALAALPDRAVVLDDMDHVAHEIGELVAHWARGLPPGRTLLVTSRVRLGHRAEKVVPVPPLSEAHAWALFQRSLPLGFTADRTEVAPLLALLDGLPLAVELAASWMDLVSAEQLAERVTTLTTRRQDRPDRHASLRAVLEGSWNLLTAPERTVLSRAGVFAGAFDLEAAEAVLGDPDLPPILQLIGRLHDKSLLLVEAGPRYRLLAPVRSYVRDRQPPSEALVRTHASHVLARMEHDSSTVEGLLDEARAAFEACLPVAPSLACGILGATHAWDWAHSPAPVAVDRARRARSAALGIDPMQAARMSWSEAQWLSRVASLEASCEVLRGALAEADLTDARPLQHGILTQLVLYLCLTEEHDEAATILSPRVSDLQQNGHPTHRIRGEMVMAMIASRQAQPTEAERWFERALKTANHPDIPAGYGADVMRFYAEHAMCAGDVPTAAERYAAALAVDGDGTYGAQLSRLSLSGALHLAGRIDEALAMLDEMESADLDPVHTTMVMIHHAWICWEQGDTDQADTLLAEAEASLRDLGRTPSRVVCTMSRIALLAGTGDAELAEAQWQELVASGDLEEALPYERVAWHSHLTGQREVPELLGRGPSASARVAWRLLDHRDTPGPCGSNPSAA